MVFFNDVLMLCECGEMVMVDEFDYLVVIMCVYVDCEFVLLWIVVRFDFCGSDSYIGKFVGDVICMVCCMLEGEEIDFLMEGLVLLMVFVDLGDFWEIVGNFIENVVKWVKVCVVVVWGIDVGRIWFCVMDDGLGVWFEEFINLMWCGWWFDSVKFGIGFGFFIVCEIVMVYDMDFELYNDEIFGGLCVEILFMLLID